MLITRTHMVKLLSKKTGYIQDDVKKVLEALDDVAFDCLSVAEEGEEVVMQLFNGCRIGCKIVPERWRIDPNTRKDILCPPTIKLFARFGDTIKDKLQQKYDNPEE